MGFVLGPNETQSVATATNTPPAAQTAGIRTARSIHARALQTSPCNRGSSGVSIFPCRSVNSLPSLSHMH